MLSQLSIYAQLALAGMQLLNWITSRITQSDWQNAGFRKAMEAYQSEMAKQVQDMRNIAAANEKKSEEELDATH